MTKRIVYKSDSMSKPRKGTSIPNSSLNWKPLRKLLDSTDLRSNNSVKEVRSSSVQRRSIHSSADLSHSHSNYQTICLGDVNQTQFKSSISSQSQDWIGVENAVLEVFQESGAILLRSDTLANVHENVRNLLESNIGSFVYDRFKSQMLKKGMAILRDKINGSHHFMDGLCQLWSQFFSNILPALDCILFRVKSKCGLTIRQTTLIAFRDEIIFKTSFEENLNYLVNQRKAISSDIRHMLLVLQSVYESYPPTKNKTHIEALTALLISPYMGYKGLFIDYDNKEPVVVSREPMLNAKRRSIDILLSQSGSRPLTVQPKQLETLNELFASAIRKKS